MIKLNKIRFWSSYNLPTILQTEITECGLACLASIASFHGYETDLSSLRRKFSIPLTGINLTNIISYARELKLSYRAIRLDIDEINNLKSPCLLHWGLNHFVVLKKISSKKITIMDPSIGVRNLSINEFSDYFTGVAVEFWPSNEFKKEVSKEKINILSFVRNISGIKKSIVKILLLAFTLEFFALTSPFYMQLLIDHGIVSEDKNLILLLSLGFVILLLFQQVITIIQNLFTMYISTNLNIQWKSNVFTHLINLPIDFFEKRHLGDIISRFSSIDSIQSTLTSSFFISICNGLVSVITLIIMSMYNFQLTLISIFTLFIYITIRVVWYFPLMEAAKENITHAAKQSSNFMETMRGIKTIKIFGKENHRYNSWLSLFVDAINSNLKTQRLSLAFSFSNKILFGIQNILIVYLGTFFIFDNTFTVGILISFLAYKNQFESRTVSLIDQFISLKMLRIHLERLSDIVLTETEFKSDILLEEKKIESSDIAVKNLYFKYSENSSYLIENLSFNICSGDSVAIVGPSGCGKSTLLNLMMGNISPTNGEIKIGDVVVSKSNPKNIRNNIGLVAQDDFLFSGSIMDNITFFDEKPNIEKSINCAKIAAIHDDIINMPMKYETLIGDMGNVLSGGQKQRLCLARALYKDPKIIFLDEATSHLDIENEKIISSNLKMLNITKVMVAHRQETIKSANKIIQLT
ncbi:peptidase domain-containing ABC transporter [Xenorhabdus bovienii]|uniref:Similar to toxin secretion ABC transporter ATP-binding protein n=1 Tax=Xenorhabdus bovienii str. feltiae Moldova TaxID=1398200 RepID=A0A077NPN4_XENBV|nr:peptidase domain-containing ABC transporter [Xenorhabdus bovienii]CDH00353.1 Similar to toxin secretion ABC transporter ATP-binding protein [Xenorhabdus bovienii str. feltiae Moldova]